MDTDLQFAIDGTQILAHAAEHIVSAQVACARAGVSGNSVHGRVVRGVLT